MGFIRTVLGDIAPEELHYTQCHEHLLIEQDKSAEVSPVLLLDDLEKTTQELCRYRRAGGKAVVDAQPVLAGRMAEWQVKASEASGVHIVASTGFHKTIFYYDDSYLFSMQEEEISRLYIAEIRQGMLSSKKNGGVRIAARAGLIKTAVDAGGIDADRVYEKLHRAAAAAQRETGAPLMCHIEQGADAAKVVDFYLNAGVAPGRLWIAHLDRANYDAGFHRELLARGVFMEYDTIARPKYHSDEDELKLIKEMLYAGYGAQLLLSLDTTRARMHCYGGETGLDYILSVFIPYLLENGVTKEQVVQMTVDNPKQALAIAN